MIAIQKIGKSFSGALGYNLKKMDHPNPQKRAELLDTNFNTLDAKLMAREVELIRSLKPNLNRYVYHTTLNFSNEDFLKSEQMLEIAKEYLAESGYDNNQYVIFRHYDAEHPHIHLLVNRITFDGEVVSDSNNYKKSEAIVRKLEAKHGLVSVAPSKEAALRAVTKGEIEQMERTGKPSDKLLLQELMNRLLTTKGMDLDELIKKGEQAGIHFLFNQATTGRVSGITYFYNGLKIRGQALGNRYKWAEIIKQSPMSRGNMARELARLTAEQQQNTENSAKLTGQEEQDKQQEEENQEDFQAQDEQELLLQTLMQMQLNARANAKFLRELQEIYRSADRRILQLEQKTTQLTLTLNKFQKRFYLMIVILVLLILRSIALPIFRSLTTSTTRPSTEETGTGRKKQGRTDGKKHAIKPENWK